MFTFGAFAIIFDAQHRVLLCHRRDMDRWNLPGGGVMSGETPWQAVIREVQEEVGLVVSVDRLIGVYVYPPGNDVIFSFLCTITGGEITESNEADAIAYFAIEQLPSTTHLHHLVRIKDVVERPEHLHLKTLPLLRASEFSSPAPSKLPSIQVGETGHLRGGQDALTKKR